MSEGEVMAARENRGCDRDCHRAVEAVMEPRCVLLE
jgi:hypothetical protein